MVLYSWLSLWQQIIRALTIARVAVVSNCKRSKPSHVLEANSLPSSWKYVSISPRSSKARWIPRASRSMDPEAYRDGIVAGDELAARRHCLSPPSISLERA